MSNFKAQIEAADAEIEHMRQEYRDAVLTIGMLLDKLGGRVEISEREIVDLDVNRRIKRYPNKDQTGIILEVE